MIHERDLRFLSMCFEEIGAIGSLTETGLQGGSNKPDTQPTALHQTDNLKIKARNTSGRNHLYNTLELLMMGIMVPETC